MTFKGLRFRLRRVARFARRGAVRPVAVLGEWYLEHGPLTAAHYYDFRSAGVTIGPDLASPAAWDVLRESNTVFGLPSSRAVWVASAARDDLAERAEAILGIARGLGARRICSYAVGGGTLELNIVRAAPEIELIATEYAPRTVTRLSALFPEATVLRHDLLRDPPPTADLHLFHRVDTEFSNRDWRTIFDRFRVPVLLVAGTLLDWNRLVVELRTRRARGATRAGYVRTPRALEGLWRRTHHTMPTEVGDLPGYLLIPRG